MRSYEAILDKMIMKSIGSNSLPFFIFFMFIILVNVFLFRLNIDFIFQYYEFLFIGMGEGGRRKSLSIKHFMVDA